MPKQTPPSGGKQIERVRKICSALLETTEKISHGEPTWFVRKKVFAMFSNNHHNDGHVAVTVPTAIGIQAALIKASPEKFYKPPYVGVRGWIGIELDRVSDEELTMHITEAWKLIAPPKLAAQMLGIANASESLPTSRNEYVISPNSLRKDQREKRKRSKE